MGEEQDDVICEIKRIMYGLWLGCVAAILITVGVGIWAIWY
jgi:hypothetical protein